MFVAEKLKVGKVRLAPELSEIVADLVLQNAAEPASLGRVALNLSICRMAASSDSWTSHFATSVTVRRTNA
jgi:hypothetical protein